MPQNLAAKLQQFNYSLQLIKKLLDSSQGISKQYFIFQMYDLSVLVNQNSNRIQTTMQKISQNIEQINAIFIKLKYSNQDKFKIQKFQKDFKKRLEVYYQLLQQTQQKKKQQIKTLRTSVHSRRPLTRKKYDQDSEYSQQGPPQIQLQQVHQQTLFYTRMIQLKQKQLLQIKDKMQTALMVQKQVGKLVKQQGQQLDVAQINIDSARSNVKQAGQLLQQGKKHHMSANKKKFCIFGIIFVVLLAILIPVLLTSVK